MPMPDIGLAPPPPVDVSAQMRPSAPPGAGGPDLMSLLSGLAGGSAPQLAPDLTPKVLEIEPLLGQLARQVPALGPDVDRLNVELKSRMGGLPAAFAGMAGPAPMTPGVAGPMGAPSTPIGGAAPPPVAGPPPMDVGAPPPQGAMGPAAMPMTPPTEMGALDLAMQVEVKLPALGKDDPTLMPYIQGFIARMREEVPKVADGSTESIDPPVQTAPTESMLSKIPNVY